MDYAVTIEPLDDKAAKPGQNISEPKSFPPGAEQVAFGRERTNDLVFPPDARIVSRNHGRLFRQRSGDYAVEAFGDHYIELDGFPAERGQHIKDGSVIRLGSKDGPAFRVRLQEIAADDAADGGRTFTQRAVQPVAQVLARLGRYQLAAFAALALIAVGVGWLWFTSRSFEDEMAELRANVTAAAKGEFSSTDALLGSVYAVILRGSDGRDKVVGTAWSYQPGLLITNAHVAILFDNLMPGQSLLVRPPGGNGPDHAVLENRLHPGYLAFKEFLATADATSTGFRTMTKGVPMPSAYDVGVLEIDSPETQAPPLAVAAGEAADVRPGMPLAFAGFPIEGVATQQTAQISPTPQLQFGAVTSLTDFFLFGSDAANALLVQNSLPATGGASGSPIVNTAGEVVAILSGGTVMETDTGRAPSAVLLNYAQRADLIAGALDPASFDVAAARAGWEATLARFDQHETAMVDTTRAALSEEAGTQVGEADLIVPTSLQSSGAVKAGTAQYVVHEIPVVAGRTYSFLVYGDFDGSLSLALFRDGKGVGGAGGGRSFANVVFTADRDETLTLRVIGQSAHPVGYKLYVFSAATPETSADSG